VHGPLREVVHMGVGAEQDESSHAQAQLFVQFATQGGFGNLADLDLPSREFPLVRERTRPPTFAHEDAMAVQQDGDGDGDWHALGHGPPLRPPIKYRRADAPAWASRIARSCAVASSPGIASGSAISPSAARATHTRSSSRRSCSRGPE